MLSSSLLKERSPAPLNLNLSSSLQFLNGPLQVEIQASSIHPLKLQEAVPHEIVHYQCLSSCFFQRSMSPQDKSMFFEVPKILSQKVQFHSSSTLQEFDCIFRLSSPVFQVKRHFFGLLLLYH